MPIVGAAVVGLIAYMFLSARAITLWSGERAAPRWAAFFGRIGSFDHVRSNPRHSAVIYGASAAALEVGLAYVAAHPATATPAGTAIFLGQIAFAVLWAATS